MRLLQACRGIRRELLPPLHADLIECEGCCLTSNLALGDFAAAERHCAWLVECYRRVYHPAHPMLGLQLYTLGDLQRHLGRREDAAASLREAGAAIGRTHGAGHPMAAGAVALAVELAAGGRRS